MRCGVRRRKIALPIWWMRHREFHLEFCRLSGNPHLVEHASRVLLPFFRLRAHSRHRQQTGHISVGPRSGGAPAHLRIWSATGEGEIAEQYIRRAMARFAETAYSNWEKTPPRSKRKNSRATE